ncbi:TPA: FCD domain-containing protein [Enterobacter hormaechei subsp. hoffmannii]|nr:FCD domain-containing protein [Enterobacter hormaechei subsp. hoffmannii]
MSQSTTQNRRWVLASRPHGAPVADNFRLEEQPIPAPAEGQVLLRTVWLSLDPYMRGRMSDAPSYSPPVEIGAVMVGGTVSRVETSRHPDYKEGEWVLGYSGWQEYELSDGQGLVKLGENPSHPSWALGVLGMPGFTAYMGLLDIGQPQAGETLVVAAACQNMTETKLDALRALSDNFSAAMHQGDVQKAIHANRVFRFTLYQYAEMPTLHSLIEQLWVRIGPCIHYLHEELSEVPAATYHYDDLLSALEQRDVTASREAIDKAIDEANILLQRQYYS